MLFPSYERMVDPSLAYTEVDRVVPDDRPYVIVGMIESIDGQTAASGRSRALGGPADKTVFDALRGIADAIVVGAGTVKAENYGQAVLGRDVVERRLAAGRAPAPTICVVTGRLSLDFDARLFTERGPRPVVITSRSAAPKRLLEAHRCARVIESGEPRVDLRGALRVMRGDGTELIVCEGGPSLNAAMLEAGLVDEIAVTIAPRVVGGDSNHLFGRAEIAQLVEFELNHVLESDGFLLLRYSRS